MYEVKKSDLIGDIEGFPIEVVQKMVERQLEARNPADVKVFQKDKSAGSDAEGFNWSNTKEGSCFWIEVISHKNFAHFFDKYPKNNSASISINDEDNILLNFKI